MPVRIYTRSGDTGETGLFGGQRVSKDDLRVEAYGAVDELNAALGLAAALKADAEIDALLNELQHELFLLGADLATPGIRDEARGRVSIERVSSALAERLERLIDRYEADLPPLTQFILPGGQPLAAALHWARVVCRRAERRCVTLARVEADGANASAPDINPEVVRYLNRLSDLLFVLARAANHRRGAGDVIWKGASTA
jgi:cob(I)alamin adenosyltransferase